MPADRVRGQHAADVPARRVLGPGQECRQLRGDPGRQGHGDRGAGSRDAVPRALLHTSAIAHVLTSKFALGVPHYRLEQDLADQDMSLDRGTMSRYVEHAGSTLGETIVHAMWQDALAHAQVIATDATGALIQPTKLKDGRPQTCKKGHFFTAVVDSDAILFRGPPTWGQCSAYVAMYWDRLARSASTSPWRRARPMRGGSAAA